MDFVKLFSFPDPSATIHAADIAIHALLDNPDFEAYRSMIGSLGIFFQFKINETPKKELSVFKYLDQLKKWPHTDELPKKFNPKNHILLVGYSYRSSEAQSLVRAAMGLLKYGLDVTFLCSADSYENKLLRENIKNFPKLQEKLNIFDPFSPKWIKPSQSIESSCIKIFQKRWNHVLEKLNSFGVTLPDECFSDFCHLEFSKNAWNHWRDFLRADFIVLRNNWHRLSNTIALDSMGLAKKSLTFQHSVVGCGVSYAPVWSTDLLCYGQSSKKIFQTLHERQNKYPTPHIIPCGSFFEPIQRISVNNKGRTLLFIDQFSDWSQKYYGMHASYESLVNLAERLAHYPGEKFHLIIRTHPDNPDAKSWESVKGLVNVDFSDGGKSSLIEDLRKANLVIGLTSTSLPLATACGVPTLFLQNSHSMRTSDLTCFDEFTVDPEEAIDRIVKILNSDENFNTVTQRSLQISQFYFEEGRNFDWDNLSKFLEI